MRKNFLPIRIIVISIQFCVWLWLLFASLKAGLGKIQFRIAMAVWAIGIIFYIWDLIINKRPEVEPVEKK